jgi:predicted component of type VI protein secretion system
VKRTNGGWFLQIDKRRVALSEGEFTIGRSRGCGVVLRDPSVSRGHALLCVSRGKVTLQDLGSSNGTFVNGKRLEGETPLAAGDRLVLGETELHLRWAESWGEARAGLEEANLFCPACGLPVSATEERCPSCEADLSGQRLPSRSEAISLGEVLPVGEVLGAPSGSWDTTRFRRYGQAAPPPGEGQPLPADPAGPVDPEDPVQQLPMSVREAEGSATTRQRSASGAHLAAPPPRGSLLHRLTARLRKRSS